MGLIDDIKKNAVQTGAKIQTSDALQLEKILNRMFYLEKNIELETEFVKQVMTRGLESQERVGLHASAIIESDNKFCVRQQVLSLLYKQLQGEQIPIGLKRIFEEGNAIHEKWQRMFIRAGYAKPQTLDRTRFDEEYQLSYTPDIVCRIPEFFDGIMIGEIKSVNPMQFRKMTSHPSAKKQLQMYMHECIKERKRTGNWNGVDYTKGFVLCDDKGAQDFKLFVYDYDSLFVAPYVDRLEAVQYHYQRVTEEGKMVKRCEQCTAYNCKRAEKCPMKDACWNKGIGRIKLCCNAKTVDELRR